LTGGHQNGWMEELRIEAAEAEALLRKHGSVRASRWFSQKITLALLFFNPGDLTIRLNRCYAHYRNPLQAGFSITILLRTRNSPFFMKRNINYDVVFWNHLMVTTLIPAWDFFGSENTVSWKSLYADMNLGLLWWLEFYRRMERQPSNNDIMTLKTANIHWAAGGRRHQTKFILLCEHVLSTSMALIDSLLWRMVWWSGKKDGLRQWAIAAHVAMMKNEKNTTSIRYINMSGTLQIEELA